MDTSAGDHSAIDCQGNPVPTATNSFGVKGAGEAGNVGALPVVANAVANALVDALSPPTPERLWRAIRDVR